MSIPEKRTRKGQPVFNIGSQRPFRMFAEKYLQAGWHPIPLPAGKKSPPPLKYTGRYDLIADEAKISEWMEEFDERANLGFRVPKGILGIDVDHYDGNGPGGSGRGNSGLDVRNLEGREGKGGRSGSGLVGSDGRPLKLGGDSLKALELELGPLPDTFVSTSRSDGISGIRWFKVPEELVWPGKLGVSIESVWHRYRFAVAPPSLHPELKEPYLWYLPGQALDGTGKTDLSAEIGHSVPRVDEIISLPQSWVDGLQVGIWAAKPYDLSSTRSDLKKWIISRPKGKTPEDDPEGKPRMCTLMRRAAEDAVEEIEGAGSAHEALNLKLYYILKLASEGHAGVVQALQAIRPVFIAEVTNKSRSGSARSEREAVDEYERSRDGAVREILGALKNEAEDFGVKRIKLPNECVCYIPDFDEPEEARDPGEYDRNDRGNAEQLFDLFAREMHWVPELGEWLTWDSERGAWEMYKEGPAQMRAIAVGKRIQNAAKQKIAVATEEAEKDAQQNGADEIEASKRAKDDEDVKSAAALYKWGIDSGNRSRINNMLELCRALPGVVLPAKLIDANAELIATPSGVYDLETGEVSEPEPSMYITKSTAVEIPEAFGPPKSGRFKMVSDGWDRFLSTSIPDKEVRAYLQKLAGYSLWGHNAERIFVFLVGPTGSGKSVFVETISQVLGDYAGPFPLSLFRDNQDDKHRSDIVSALPRRFIGTSEASRSWSLHADQIKRITGGETISARAPYGRGPIERVPAFTPWISSNETPTISGIDSALRRRLRVARFPKTIAGTGADVPGLKRSLCEGDTGKAVLGWLLAGARAYKRDGLNDVPYAMDKELMAFAAEASGHLGAWINELFIIDPEGMVTNRDITDSYTAWCIDNDINEKEKVSTTKLGLFLNEQGASRSEQKKIDGANTRVRYGIRFLDDSRKPR